MEYLGSSQKMSALGYEINHFLEFEKYGFQENVDYTLLAKNSVNPKGGRPQSDYLLLKYPHV